MGINETFALAVQAHQAGRLDEAFRLLSDIVRLDPRHVQARARLATVLFQLGRYEQGLRHSEAGLELVPRQPVLLLNHGLALLRLGRFVQALTAFDSAIALSPGGAEVHRARGAALLALSRGADALSSFDRALTLSPQLVDAHLGRADALAALERYGEALEAYDRVASVPARAGAAQHGRGRVLAALGRDAEALDAFDRAVGVQPDSAALWNDRAVALQQAGQHAAALESFARASALAPRAAESRLGQGRLLHQMDRSAEALACFESVLSFDPKNAEAAFGAGVSLGVLGRFEEAARRLNEAVTLEPSNDRAFSFLGSALIRVGRIAEAIAALEQALRLNPNVPYALGELLHVKRQICDWADTDAIEARLLERLASNELASNPFILSTVAASSPAQQLHAAQLFAARWAASDPPPRRARKERIKLGYFSSDFHTHATTALIAEMLEKHDRAAFEVVAFNLAPTPEDDGHRRMRGAVDTFVDVASLTDGQTARRARDMEIDIAVDLKGYTFGSRSGVFAHRAAPIQVNYLGYPGTMGASFIDYIIADRQLIADEERAFFSENLVRLPHTYQPVDTTRWNGQAPRPRTEYGLPEEGLVFCCFNNAFKITPALLDCWARILRATDGAVLWLLGDSDAMIANIGKEAASRGIAGRIVFAPRVSMAEHLTRHRAADLFLDCLPCTAHTTASEALLAGLPVLTIKGETFAGRVAASVLKAVGMRDLITFSMEEYEAAALRLAHDRAALMALKARLAETRLSSPLFDTTLYTRHLEDAYRQMCERYWAGEAPAPFDIAARQGPGG